MAINKTSLLGKKTRIKGVKIIDPPPGIRPVREAGEPPEALVNSMRGMGDNIFQRPYVATLCGLYDKVFIDTPWPHLYADMPSNLILLSPKTNLRTQKKNAEKHKVEYHFYPRSIQALQTDLSVRKFNTGYRLTSENIYQELDSKLPRSGFFFHMDPPNEWGDDLPFDPSEPYCLIRNTTTRNEWYAPSRNCLNKYLQYAARKLSDRGIRIYEIADLHEGREVLDGDPIEVADQRFVKGELGHPGLIWAFHNAAAIISPVGFPLLLAQMVKANALILFGGHQRPEYFNLPDGTYGGIQWAAPEPFCSCHNRTHRCNKKIPKKKIDEKLNIIMGKM